MLDSWLVGWLVCLFVCLQAKTVLRVLLVLSSILTCRQKNSFQTFEAYDDMDMLMFSFPSVKVQQGGPLMLSILILETISNQIKCILCRVEICTTLRA